MKKLKTLLLLVMAIFACSVGSLVSCTDDVDYTDEALKAVHGAWVDNGAVSIWEPDGKTHKYYNSVKCGYYFDTDGYVYNIIDGEITDSKIKYSFNRAWGKEGEAISIYIFEFEFEGEAKGVTEFPLYIQEGYLYQEGNLNKFVFDETITR